MILKQEEFKKVCSIISNAVDSTDGTIQTETLELKSENGVLKVNVTNNEYYVSVSIFNGLKDDFRATVNASLFLKLISQITTEDIELVTDKNYLYVKANGKYKIPLIFDNDKLLELSEIKIDNVTCEMEIETEVLNSILTYNSKELQKNTCTRPVQRYYYVDNMGAITFTTGACVNNFALDKPVKLLFSQKLVKLFKLFKSENVKFKLGYDEYSRDIIQTKVQFDSDDISIRCILSCDDTMLNSVPVNAIRGIANNIYPYSVNINKDALLQTINRLMIFSNVDKSRDTIVKFEFDRSSVVIYDKSGENSEELKYTNNSNVDEMYTAYLELNDLKLTLDSCIEKYITLNFGDGRAFVVKRLNISNVIPEGEIV